MLGLGLQSEFKKVEHNYANIPKSFNFDLKKLKKMDCGHEFWQEFIKTMKI